jgi:uncharacterized UPF0160 family protein
MDKLIYYTHAGRMHADETMGYVICQLADVCYDFVRLISLDDIPNDGLVADIGRIYDPPNLRFDHHQGLLLRDNGVPLATAGLLWRQYGHLVVRNRMETLEYWDASKIESVCRMVDASLIQGLDANDADNEYRVTAKCSSGDISVITLSDIIRMHNAQDVDNHSVQDGNFYRAALLLKSILISKVDSGIEYYQHGARIDEIINIRNTVAIIPKQLRWKRWVNTHYPALNYVIIPSHHPGSKWALVAVAPDLFSREVKIPIERPDWFKGFIHQGKWIAGSNDKSLLIELADYNIKRADETIR